MDALLGFLSSYGSALVDRGKPSVSDEVELEVVRPGIEVKDGPVEAHDVLLRQVLDGFQLADSLVGGRFVGNDLVSVGGCLVDPASSQPRTKTLAVPTQDAARAAFAAELGTSMVTDTTPVKGRLRHRLGTVTWFLYDHRLDAESGAYLGKVATDPGDPELPTESGQ